MIKIPLEKNWPNDLETLKKKKNEHMTLKLRNWPKWPWNKRKGLKWPHNLKSNQNTLMA